jgi:hypothetical protein
MLLFGVQHGQVAAQVGDDRARELGAFANPKGRPRRKNSAIGNTA